MRRESVVATVVRRSVSNDNFSPSSTHYDSVAHGRSLGCERARGSVDCGSRASSPGRVWRIERRRHHRRQHAGIDRSRGDTLLRGRGSRLRASARSGTAFRRAASARCDLPRRRRAIQSLYGPMVAGRPRPAACPGRRSCTSRLRRGREPWTRSRATNLTSRRLRTEDFPFRRESPSADSLPQLSRDGARADCRASSTGTLARAVSRTRLRQCRRLVLAISGRHGRSLRGCRDGTLLRRRVRVHVLDRNCLRGLRGFRLAHVSGGLRFDRCGMPFSLLEQRFLQPRGRPVRVHARLQRRHHVRALPLLRGLARRGSLHDRQRLPGRQLSERWMLSERRRKPLHRRRAMRQ